MSRKDVPTRVGVGGGSRVGGLAVWSCCRVLAAAVLVIFAGVFSTPQPVSAAGPNAILTPTGYNTNVIARGDDTSNLIVNLPFTMNWNGTNYTQIYVNMNGNCTFGSGFTGYNPNTTLAATNRSIMAPLWADVDTRNTAAAQVTYSTTTGSVPQVNGHNAFFVNWVGVASYNNQSSPTNSFQLVIVDRSDTGAGNFDFMFNYDQVAWDIATAASTYRARAGWGRAGTGFELPGSGTPQGSASTLLDSSPSATSLIQNSMNAGGQLGRYVWQVRSGAAPNVPPQVSVVNRVLEGNAPNSYTGYTGSGDATATDPDGTIVSFTNNRPSPLPLGTTSVLWTATDDRAAVTTATQTIVVTDTTPPVNPTLTSPTHTTGTWSASSTVTVASAGATDTCTGVRGFSYAWSRGSTSTPDTVPDPSIATTTTTTATTTVDSQTFPNATWPPAWTRSSTAYVRLTNAAGRNHGTYAAEIWANNTTRRTVDFYRDYDLAGFTSATLTFWDNVSALAGGTDYARVEYSTDGGANYIQLQNLTTASAWTQRSFNLPAGGTVRVRFSGSVNAATEYADWDDINVLGFTTTTTTTLSTSTTTGLADGTWYFNLHTVDVAGNWSSPRALGPFLIDTTAPVTTDNVPAGWSTTALGVTLTAVDAGVVSYTEYSLNGSPWSAYTGPFVVSTEGTSTLLYRSADAAGHVEATKTVLARIDTQPPSVPFDLAANAVSTSSVELSWSPSADNVSGVARYGIYRDGTLVGTTSGTTFVDTGLTAGGTYLYEVSAFDVAGNESLSSFGASETVPLAALWVSVSTPSVDMGDVDPGGSSAVTDAAVVTVGGVGTGGYSLLCSAQDFTNVDVGSTMPTLPASALSYTMRGFASAPSQPFTEAPVVLDSAVGSRYRWGHQYDFDFLFVAPWTFESGHYATTVTYTAVSE